MKILKQFGKVSTKYWHSKHHAYLWEGTRLILITDDYPSEAEAVSQLYDMLKITLWNRIVNMENQLRLYE